MQVEVNRNRIQQHERLTTATMIRHGPFGGGDGAEAADRLRQTCATVRPARPVCEWIMRHTAWRNGVKRTVNGIPLRVPPEYRWMFPAVYEKTVSEFLSGQIRPGAVCLNVGAKCWDPCPGDGPLVGAGWPRDRLRAKSRVCQDTPADDRFEWVRVAFESWSVRYQIGAVKWTSTWRVPSGKSRLGGPNPLIRDPIKVTRVDVVTLDEYCTQQAIMPDWISHGYRGF